MVGRNGSRLSHSPSIPKGVRIQQLQTASVMLYHIQHLPGIQTVCGAAHQPHHLSQLLQADILLHLTIRRGAEQQHALRFLWNIGFHYVSLGTLHPGETFKPNQPFFLSCSTMQAKGYFLMGEYRQRVLRQTNSRQLYRKWVCRPLSEAVQPD